MRDIKRIPIIIKKLERAWKLVPDWRLGQLISNLQGVGKQDIFFTEDDEWEIMIDNLINEYE